MVVVVVVLVAVLLLLLLLPLLPFGVFKNANEELNCARNDASQQGTNHV